MSNYIPPDAHHVVLNFEDLITSDTNLNFGATQQNFADIDAVINTTISADILVLEQAIADIDAIINTQIAAELLVIEQAVCDIDAHVNCLVFGDIEAIQTYMFDIDAVINTTVFAEIFEDRIDEYCDIDAAIFNQSSCDIAGEWSIDNDRGVSNDGFSFGFKQAFTVCAQTKIPWSKAVLVAKNGAIYFEDGLSIGNAVDFVLQQAETLSESIAAHFQQATGLGQQTKLVWQETLKFSRSAQIQFEDGQPLAVQRSFEYQELVRLRKQFTFAHEVAEQFQKTFSFNFDKALEITTTTDIVWQEAEKIHYIKHPVKPWIKPEFVYEGDGILNFRCPCETDAWNVILNFGQDDCMPYSPKKKWWHILNKIEVTRLDNGQPIKVISGTYESGRDRIVWSQSITVAPSEIAKLQPIDDQPVVLKIVINGFEQWMMLEGEPKEVRKFAETTFTYQGRSITAKLTADYSAKRSYIQESQLYSKQLCEREIERVYADTLIDWQHIDELGWQVDAEGLSYTNLAPLEAIKLVVEAGGGFIYSPKAADTLTILPKYKKSHWEVMQFSDYDLVLSENYMLQHSIDPIPQDLDYNAITLINSRNGNDARAGFGAKDTDLPDVSNPMFGQLSMAGYAKAELTKAGIRTVHTFSQMFVSQEIGEMLPGKIISFDEQWWGVIDSVSGTWNHKEVWETLKVEQISRE